MNRTIVITSFVALLFSACTAKVAAPTSSPTVIPSVTPTETPSSTATPTPSAPAGCYYQQVQCVKAPCDPVLVCASPSATTKSTTKPSPTVKAEVKSENTVRSNTNININSNGVKVEITNKNGEKYAKVTIDGKEQEVKLDANGCYDYNNNGTKIHACNN